MVTTLINVDKGGMMEIISLNMRDKNLINSRGKNLIKPFKPLLKSMCPLWLIISFILILSGCGAAPKQFIRTNVNFQYIKKVAVLPFNNLTDDRYASEKFKSIIVMDVLEAGVFEMAEEGEVNKAIADVFREMGFREGELVALDIDSIKRISEKLGVQAVFIGSVESYGQSRVGGAQYGIVSISLRLVESSSGITLWRGFHSEKGSSLMRSIFGIEQKNEIELSRELSKKLLATLFGK